MVRDITPGIVLNAALDNLGLDLDNTKKELLLQYCNLLLQGHNKKRLTAENSITGLIKRQIFDSLYPIKIIGFAKGSRLADLGSGGGLPGVPLAICLPDCTLFLIEASENKAEFLEKTAYELQLENIVIVKQRAELSGHDARYREQFDFVLSKAVAEAAVLAELTMPLLLPGGKAIFYKGPRGVQEMAEAARALSLCGGKVISQYNYDLPSGEKRTIYLIGKVAITPAQYPRSAGKPARRPLK